MQHRLKGSGKDRKYLSEVYGFRDKMKKAGKRGSKRS
jgi:hypothetical protein